MASKKRIAFFGVGLFQTKTSTSRGPGVPSLMLLLNNLASNYDLVVYRLSKGGIQSQNIKVRSLPFDFLGEKLNYGFILIRFFLDHLQERFVVINALSAMPSGRIAVTLGKIFNIPVVLHLHAAEAVAMQELRYGDILNPNARRLTRLICDRTKIITALTQFQKRIIEETLEVLVPIQVIHHGCNNKLFSFNPKEIENPVRILYVGYDSVVKNPIGALKVFSSLSKEINATLTMMGAGLTRERFSNENISFENISFRELVTHSSMPDVFRSHDLLLVTSFYESQSSVAIEAMASGVLVCGTPVGILADLSGHACMTFTTNDYESQASDIIKLIRTPEQIRELKANARQWTEKYDHLWTIKQYQNIFESITNN